jgi:Xaa-Pro aminopeptidase
VTPERHAERRQAILAKLEATELDGIIVTHLPNVRYLTGFTGSSGVLLVTRSESVFLSDFRYRTQAEQEIGSLVQVEIVPSDVWSRIWQLLGELPNLSRVGFEEHAVTALSAREFADAADGLDLQPVSGLVEQLRASKDAEEVTAIREAARLAHEALAAILGRIRVGLREIDVAAELERELRIRGSEWHPFPTIVASGPRSALPHAGTDRREIRSGDLLLLDFGAQVSGYCADITRTFVVGAKADERQRTVYELVRRAQSVARENIAAGMTGKEADSLARALIESHGYGDAFGHSLGHGLGLEVHEDPRVSRTNEDLLPQSSVVTIEPGIYLPGFGGVRIEDDVYLGAEGGELLSDGRTELVELT